MSVTEINMGNKDEAMASHETLKRAMPVFLKHVVLIAELRKASYDAHLIQGFTVEQALELCKTLSI